MANSVPAVAPIARIQLQERYDRVAEIPSAVYEEVLQRIQNQRGGVLPPSGLVQSSPTVIMTRLDTLK